jgi:hypothetical protein
VAPAAKMRFTHEFSRQNKCNGNFLEKIVAAGIFSRKILQQEFSRENRCNRNFLEKIIATGIFSRNVPVAKW